MKISSIFSIEKHLTKNLGSWLSAIDVEGQILNFLGPIEF